MHCLAKIGLQPLVLKGAAYAQTLYPEAHLRPRCDTDLLFPDRESAQKAWMHLEEEGYVRIANVVEGRYVSRQQTCVKPGGVGHALDLHWSISNTHVRSGSTLQRARSRRRSITVTPETRTDLGADP